MTHFRFPLLLCALSVAWGLAQARVVDFRTVSVKPAFEGRVFGTTGAYERIDAVASFAVDPRSAQLANIVDIGRAPVNAAGLVEFSTQVTVLRAADPARRSATLLYEVPNRGRSHAMVMLNLGAVSNIPGKAAEAGDGFLMQRGTTVVWSGWQSDIGGPLINMQLPVLDSVRGTTREQFVFDKPGATGVGELTYPASDLDPARAVLTVRARDADLPRVLQGAFRYVAPNRIEITRPADMDAGAIYEFVYPAQGAVPAGLAFAATRDLVSFLRGNPGHALASPLSGIQHTLGLGISQSGRFVRDFIYEGFNADEGGRRVFDGAMPHIAGSRKTYVNYRFAQPSRYSRQHEDHDFPGDQFPFTYADTTDPVSGNIGSLLSACRATATCPRIVHVDSSTEFYQARAYLLNTTPDGKPVPMPPDVRLYFVAGAPHFNRWGAGPEAVPVCARPSNPLNPSPVLRALYVALEDWVGSGKAPPASRFPSLDDKTLVPLAQLQLPRIAGSVAQPAYNHLQLMDTTVQPPLRGKAYPAYVPGTDADGNDLGGVRLPFVQAPLATFTGWNPRAQGYGAGDLCNVYGGYAALPRQATPGDSRTPLAVRYPEGAKSYVEQVDAAVSRLVQERFMLEGDRALVLERARVEAATAFAAP
ncbi:alpha/beta hydrolase domain-containing protein [Pseudorhodoferax soli]|uniref:Alpha/beta hydrolase domain-containing protein n=1 Tax=Pseudorhodoferax soli TaxID=545864 RepID=A0A368XLR4_9BURK|nr:alpha/beta hydrolase domain-containing protein [Pseudorhodoferax soli]RCW68880.1 hypothetical protein DES41_107405 [Pseudorhodoferax soli]